MAFGRPGELAVVGGSFGGIGERMALKGQGVDARRCALRGLCDVQLAVGWAPVGGCGLKAVHFVLLARSFAGAQDD